MRLIPKTPRQQVDFFATLLPAWSQDPASMGLTPQQLAQLQQLTDDTRAAIQAAADARSKAQSATLAMENASEQLVKAGSAAIAAIKLAAKTDPAILITAQIAQSDAPAVQAPHAPAAPRITIDPFGAVTLSWQGVGPTGTENGPGARGGSGLLYLIHRQAPGEAAPRIVGATGELRFTDDTAPLIPGAPLMYWVQACRGKRHSPLSAPAPVQLPAVIQTTTTAAKPMFDENMRRRAA